jgi:hypothetical protein
MSPKVIVPMIAAAALLAACGPKADRNDNGTATDAGATPGATTTPDTAPPADTTTPPPADTTTPPPADTTTPPSDSQQSSPPPADTQQPSGGG